MPKFLLKIFIIVFAFAIFALPIFARAISASGPIVTCGREGQPFCNLCDIPILIKNLIDYMTFYVAFPLAALMFVVGGYFYLIAGGSSQKISQAKEVFFTTIKGLGIVLLSWLFIAELMVILTGGTNFNGLSQPWNQLESPASCPFGTPVLVLPPPPPSYGCDYDDAGNGICVLGGPGTSCSPSDPSACGGGGGGYGCDYDDAGNGICVLGGPGIACSGPSDSITCGGGGAYYCVADSGGEFTGACVIGGNSGVPCTTASAATDCPVPPPVYGCNSSNQCVVGGTGGSCNPANGNVDCTPLICGDGICSPGEICALDGCCDPFLFCPAPPPTHHYEGGDGCTSCGFLVPNDDITVCWDLCWDGQWKCQSTSAGDCQKMGVCCNPGSLPQ